MKDLQTYLSGYEARMIKEAHGDFPSYAHQIAWLLCEYFKEPYGFWVRNVLYSALNPGQIKYEFEQIQKKPFTNRTKAKMLMSTMKIQVKKTVI